MVQAAMAVLMLATASAAPVQHRQMKFNCYVAAENPEPVDLFEKSSDTSKVVFRIPRGVGMLTTVDRVKHRGDWIYVRWTPDLDSKEKPRRGWIRYKGAMTGECED